MMFLCSILQAILWLLMGPKLKYVMLLIVLLERKVLRELLKC